MPLFAHLHAELLELAGGRSSDAWLFAAPRGGMQHPNNWRSRVWSPAVRGTEFEELGLTPHGLRHTAASMAITSRADVKVVQEMLGHASATETLDRYGHLWPDRLDEVADAVSAERARALGELATDDGEALAA